MTVFLWPLSLSMSGEMERGAKIVERFSHAIRALVGNAPSSVGDAFKVKPINGEPDTYWITLDLSDEKWSQLDSQVVDMLMQPWFRLASRQAVTDVHGRLVGYAIKVNIGKIREEYLQVPFEAWVLEVTAAFRADPEVNLPLGCVIGREQRGERTALLLCFNAPLGIDAEAAVAQLANSGISADARPVEHRTVLYVEVPGE